MLSRIANKYARKVSDHSKPFPPFWHWFLFFQEPGVWFSRIALILALVSIALSLWGLFSK